MTIFFGSLILGTLYNVCAHVVTICWPLYLTIADEATVHSLSNYKKRGEIVRASVTQFTTKLKDLESKANMLEGGP